MSPEETLVRQAIAERITDDVIAAACHSFVRRLVSYSAPTAARIYDVPLRKMRRQLDKLPREAILNFGPRTRRYRVSAVEAKFGHPPKEAR